MFQYDLNGSLNQAVENIVEEHQSSAFGFACIETTVPIADIILRNGVKAQVHLKITTEEFDFIEHSELLTIDFSAGKEEK